MKNPTGDLVDDDTWFFVEYLVSVCDLKHYRHIKFGIIMDVHDEDIERFKIIRRLHGGEVTSPAYKPSQEKIDEAYRQSAARSADNKSVGRHED